MICSGHHIHGDRLLHRQLEQNAADPVVTVIHNTLDRGRDDLRQIIAAILRGNIANVKMDCFLDELTLAGTVIRLIPLAHLLQRGFPYPERKFSFSLCILCHIRPNTSCSGHNPQSDPREFAAAPRTFRCSDPQVDPTRIQPTHTF